MLNKFFLPLLLTCFGLAVPAGLHPAQAKPKPSAMQGTIEHVVVLILENRSFDNLLAWLYEEDVPHQFLPAGTDPHYQGLSEETLSLYTNLLKNSSGQTVLSSPPIKGVPSIAGTPYLNSPVYDPHESYPHVLTQIYGSPAASQPTMTGFLQDYGTLWYEDEWQKDQTTIFSCMETYTDVELPVLYGLAKHYAVSDQWFSSVPTMTNPNRAFAACGTSQGQTLNGPMTKSTFTVDTIWNLLSDTTPDTTWMIFWQGDMFPGFYSGPFTGPNNFVNMTRIPNLSAHYQKIDSFHELARNGQLPQFSFIEPQLSTLVTLENLPLQIGMDSDDSSSSKPDSIHSPIGVLGNDYHPPGDVRTGENLLANIYTSLIANPEAWSKTLLVVTFDEHGGLFDHVPPPAAIPPDSCNQEGFSFDRYGVRVPALFISPLVEQMTVVRSDKPGTPFDHTSLIATILDWLNIDSAQWNMGARTAAAPTFDSVITLTAPRNDPVIAPPNATLPNPGADQIVNMGDSFYLRDANGNYLVQDDSLLFKHLAHAGSASNKVAMTFTGGSGNVTHGSFVLIQSQDTTLGSENLLSSFFINCQCLYESNSHEPHQWWTIKSVDNPYVGANICYGDRVYLENHMFEDPSQFVPKRLVKDDGLLSDLLTTNPVTDPESNTYYWIIEKISD